MAACDFFTKDIYTLTSKYTAYVLIFIHLGTREFYASPATYAPHGDWVTQQARNSHMWLEDEELDVRFLLHDRDTKFSACYRDAA